LSLGPPALWTLFPNMSGSQPMYYINELLEEESKILDFNFDGL
jgi:hypothetical protein